MASVLFTFVEFEAFGDGGRIAQTAIRPMAKPLVMSTTVCTPTYSRDQATSSIQSTDTQRQALGSMNQRVRARAVAASMCPDGKLGPVSTARRCRSLCNRATGRGSLAMYLTIKPATTAAPAVKKSARPGGIFS